MALRRIVEAAMTGRRGCETSSCFHLESAVSARSMLSRREDASMKTSPTVLSLLNRGKSMSMSTRIPSGTPSIHPEQPPSPTIAQTSKSRFHCNHRTRHAGVVVDRHSASQSSHRLPAVLNPQGSAAASTCTMSHPYHTHPFPAASRSRFLNGLPLPHRHRHRGDATTTTTPQKERKGQRGIPPSRRRGLPREVYIDVLQRQ